MGKVRTHIANNSAAMAQWVFRKLRNHDPMSERCKVKHEKRTSVFQRVGHEEGQTVVYYQTDTGLKFKITVEEVTETSLYAAQPVKKAVSSDNGMMVEA